MKDGSIKSINVLNVVYRHLNNSLLYSECENPLKGLYIKPKPKTARIDIIELNLLFCAHNEDEIVGVVNINYYEEDLERIKVVAPIIVGVMEDAFCDNYLFEIDRSETFRASQKLYYHNIRIQFSLPEKYYDFKAGKVINS